MKNKSELAYSEVYAILSLLEDDYRKRIPTKIIEFFKKEKDLEYIPNIDVSKPLEEQNLKRETIVILAILNLNYWCETEEEKTKFYNELVENDKQYQKELREKYNPDNIFEEENNNVKGAIKKSKTTDECEKIIKYNNSFIRKLVNKIKMCFEFGGK